MFNLSLSAQDIDKITFLKNGKIYSPDLTYYPAGNQYFMGHDFSTGCVFVNQIEYDSVLINIDIHQQQLLLKYKSLNNSEVIIQLSKAWIDSFYVYGKRFILKDSLKKKYIYQVIGNSKNRIYIYHYKNLLKKSSTDGLVYYFTSRKTNYYLKSKDGLEYFKNRRTFLKLFDRKYKSEIKKFLKSNSIKVKKADDKEFEMIINFVEDFK